MDRPEYSRISLTWHPRDQTGVGLSDIPDYQTASILTSSCRYVSYFYFTIKRSPFSIITGPVTSLTSEHIAVNHLHKTLSNCDNLCSFHVCHFDRSFTPSIHAMYSCDWSFCYFVIES